jgi:hypothetical protein
MSNISIESVVYSVIGCIPLFTYAVLAYLGSPLV